MYTSKIFWTVVVVVLAWMILHSAIRVVVHEYIGNPFGVQEWRASDSVKDESVIRYATHFVHHYERSVPGADSFTRFDVPTRDGRTWRWAAVGFISYHYSFYSSTDWHVYQFGVAGGGSVATILKGFAMNGVRHPMFWGVDSFEGIPLEAAGVSRPAGWKPGTYDSSKQHPLSGWKCRKGSGAEQAGSVNCTAHADAKKVSFQEQVAYMRAKYGFTEDRVKFVPGFYNESLVPGLITSLGLRPAMYVDIDCDLYISTYQALDFMFAHKLAVVGTLIGYDDYCLTNLGIAGESRAHKEIAHKYGVNFKCVVGGCTDEMMSVGNKTYNNMKSSKMNNPVFLVTFVGSTKPRTGMDNGYPAKCVHQSKHWKQVVGE